MQDEIVRVLQGLLPLAIQGSIFVLFVVLAILNRQAFKRHWKTGLALGIACFVMMVPGAAFSLAHFDASSVVSHMKLPFPPDAVMKVFACAVVLLAGAILLLRIGWDMIVYYVAAAEWDRVRPGAFPLLGKTGKPPWRPILLAVAFGIGAGALSVHVFLWLGVEEGEAIRKMFELFPGAGEASIWIRAPVMLLTLSVPAVVEELVFRGGALGFLLRVSGKHRVAIAASVVGTSLLWALLHIPNTDAPLVKCAQMLIIGVVLAEFARRSCIEAAMAGHLGLNVSVTVIALASG